MLMLFSLVFWNQMRRYALSSERDFKLKRDPRITPVGRFLSPLES